MPSQALLALEAAIEEVVSLQSANPSPSGATPQDPGVTRAVGRASVVLLVSHYERYVHSLNEEAVSWTNTQQVRGDALPENIRLLHAKVGVEELVATSWESSPRADRLKTFATSETWLWRQGENGTLDHLRLLLWMKSPNPKSVQRYFRYWGIDDIFSAITTRQHTKTDLYLRITELVDKRNAIAHGDLSTEATQADVRSYIRAVKTFCTRTDKKVARQISRILSTTHPW
jgi:hypothetical protein